MLLAGCALGPRPTLQPDERVDDAAIEAVLEHLDGALRATFTGTYVVTPSLAGATPAEVTVHHDGSAGEGRTKVVVNRPDGGVVEYVDLGGELRTCQGGFSECVAGYDEARISDLSITSSFWGVNAERRLSTDADRDIADAEAGTESIADQPATCATVTLSEGVATYCALDAGPLARYVGNDVTIELTAFDGSVDQAVFAG